MKGTVDKRDTKIHIIADIEDPSIEKKEQLAVL